MNIIEKRIKLMVFICEKFHKDSIFQECGEYFENLIDEAEIDFDEGEGNSAEFYYFLEKKLIKYKKQGKHNNERSLIVPTVECMNIIENRGESWLKKNWPLILTALVEGTTKSLINRY